MRPNRATAPPPTLSPRMTNFMWGNNGDFHVPITLRDMVDWDPETYEFLSWPSSVSPVSHAQNLLEMSLEIEDLFF